MRILGIDPGLQRTGFGVVDVDGPRLQYVASGTISTLEAARGNLPARLKIIFSGVAEVMARYQPQAASVEIVFVNVNPQSTLLLGQARGAALAALVQGEMPVAEYTALQMKKAVVGHGLANKDQIQEMAGSGDHPCPRRAQLRSHCQVHGLEAAGPRAVQTWAELLTPKPRSMQ